MRDSPKSRCGVALSFVLALMVGAGCSSVPSDGAVALHQAVVQLSSETVGLLNRIENTAVESDVRRVTLDLDLPLLSEQDFAYAIDSKTKAALIEQLGAVESYLQALRAIATGDYRGMLIAPAVQIQKAFGRAASSVNDLAKYAEKDELKRISDAAGALAGAIATLGELIIESRTQSRAREVVRRTQPHLAAYLTGLAEVFSKTDDEALAAKTGTSLASILENEFQTQLGSINRQWQALGRAPTTATQLARWEERRERLARLFLATLRGRQLAPSAAVGLRKSCIAIARAHGTLLKKDGQFDMAELESGVSRLQFLARVFDDVRGSSTKETEE